MLRLCVACIVVQFATAMLSAADERVHGSRELVIGALFPLSGFAADVGQSELNAATMALDDIKAAEPAGGITLRLQVEDYQSDFSKLPTAVHKLAHIDKVDALLGPTWIEFSEVAAPLAQSAKLVMLTASGYSPGLTAERPYVFSTMPDHENALRPLSDYIVRNQPKRLAMLKAQNAFFEQISTTLSKQLAQAQIEFFKVIEVPADQTDFRSVILLLKKEAIDTLVFFAGIGSGTSIFLKQAKALKWSPRILTTSNLQFDEGVQKDKSIANGVLFLEYYCEAPNEFIERYRRRYGHEPVYSAPRAYDNVFLLKNAAEKCGLGRDAIRRCLQATNYQGTSGPIEFAFDRRLLGTQKVTRLRQVVKGAYAPLEAQ